MENNSIASNDYYMRARALFAAEKHSEAERYYKLSLEKDPMNINAYMGLVHLHIKLKQYDKAKDNLKKILVIDNKNGEVYFHLGNIAYMQKDAIGARSNYSKALSYGYENPVAQYYMAMSNLATKDIVNAKFYLNQILQNDKAHAKARIKLIEIAGSEKNYDEMLIQAEELILNRPDAFEGYHYKFLALLNQDCMDAAANTILHAIKLFPGDYGFALDLIVYYVKNEEYEEALKYLDIRFGNDDKAKRMVMPQKAKILFKLMRFEEAEKVFEEISEEYLDEESLYFASVLAMSRKQYDKALKHCEKIIERYKNGEYYCAALCYKGLCLEKMNKLDEAKAAIKLANEEAKAESMKAPGKISLFVYRVLCEMQLENYDSALELADYALTLSDDNVAEIYMVRGMLYKKINENEKSRQDFDKAISLNAALKSFVEEVSL